MASQAAQLQKIKDKELQSSRQRLGIPPVSQITTLYRVKNSGRRNHRQHKGQGCFATQNIPRGTPILVECPLFSVRKPCNGGQIAAEVNRLTSENLDLYRALSGLVPNQIRTDFEIFRANSIEASQIGRPAGTDALFIKGSRFNYSCVPNAYFTYHASRPAHMTINAMVPIQKNEIFINYNAQTNFATRAQRRQALHHWRIDCDCFLCTENSVESDQRRQKMRTLEARIKRNQLACDNRQQLALTNQRHAEILQEIRKDSYDLYDLCVAEGIIYPARAEALQWLANCYVEAAELDGCHPV